MKASNEIMDDDDAQKEGSHGSNENVQLQPIESEGNNPNNIPLGDNTPINVNSGGKKSKLDVSKGSSVGRKTPIVISVLPVSNSGYNDTGNKPEWNQSPYTRGLDGPSSTPADGSIVSDADVFAPVFQMDGSNRGRSDARRNGSGNRVGVQDTPEDNTSHGAISPTAITLDSDLVNSRKFLVTQPPVGHHSDFRWSTPQRRSRRLFWDGSGDPEEYAFQEESFSLTDTSTILGRMNMLIGNKRSNTLRNKENRAQVRNAVRLAEHIIKVPLSKVWHTFTEVVVNLIFFTNVAVAIADIVRGPEYFYYKVTALVLGILQNSITAVVWIITRRKKFKSSPNYERNTKRLQYFENILGEVLMYPLLILSVVGFTTEKMYEVPSNTFGWVQLVLIILDVVSLFITQTIRMYMLYKLMRDLRKVFSPAEENPGCCKWDLAGRILPRAYHTIAGNLVLMLVLIGLFGCQCNRDNATTSDYRLSTSSGLLMMCFILLPNLSLLLFVIENAYWLLELFMTINFVVGSDKGFQEDLKEHYGEMVAGTLRYTMDKMPTSDQRLHSLKDTNSVRKFLYAVTELLALVLLCFWQLLVFLALYYFDGFADATSILLGRVVFAVVCLVANPHTVVLSVLGNFLAAAGLASLIVYPIFVPLCMRKKTKMRARNRNETDSLY